MASAIITAMQANPATTGRLFLFQPRTMATRNPQAALMGLLVAVKMAGMVIAVRQAYGT